MNNPNIYITNADVNFCKIFHHNDMTPFNNEDRGIQFTENFTDVGTSSESIQKLQNSMISNESNIILINLYRFKDRCPLSCYISCIPLGNNHNNAITRMNERLNGQNIAYYAILTIGSASSLGNSREYGIGLHGIANLHLSDDNI